MDDQPIPHWRLNPHEAAVRLGARENGFDTKEAKARLLLYGPNETEKADKKTPIKIFLSQFQNPLIYILIGASIVAGFLGDQTEALIIFAIIVINAFLGFIQEYRSEKALEELRKYVSMTARVMRDGSVTEIPVRELVPGDTILVSIGDIVPADARLIEVFDLEANESILTGESNPVEKRSAPILIDEPAPHEMQNTLFMGSTISAGSGKAIVVATGSSTFLGKSAKSLGEPQPSTDFERSIRDFGSMLVKVIMVMTFFVFIINGLLGHNLLQSFLFALAIAVGITPELLPIIITIGLSHGAVSLVRKHVAVKRLQAIEDLGNIDVLCADKTGTLTENSVTLIRYVDTDGKDDERILLYSLLCNSAVVQHGKVKGGTIDSAIWSYALTKFDTGTLKPYRKIDEMAFDYQRKRMSVVVEKGDQAAGVKHAGRSKGLTIITKGAPENMIEICTKVLRSGKEVPIGKERERIMEIADQYGSQGYRVIVVAYKDGCPEKDFTAADEQGMVLYGFLILMDPPKKDAMPALERFKKLGVDIYVLTGDGPSVTGEVCRQLGVHNKSGRIVLGSEIAGLEIEAMRKVVMENNIFARLTPPDKLMIVKALQANGHIVGFIGDGVNDAPSLKAADAGISVSNGADIAKEASDVVLLRKSLNVVANGIHEGRSTFGNIIKYINNTISANFGNMFTLTIASLFLPFIPLLPSQILLNNLLSDIPMITVSTDNVDKEDLRTPKRWDIRSITRFMIFFGLISSVFDLITMGFLLFFLKADITVFRTIWFLESAMSEIYVVFAIRTAKPFYKSMPSMLLIGATLAVTFISVGIFYSPLAPAFEFAALSPGVLLIVFLIVFSYVIVVEGAKMIFYHRLGNGGNGNNGHEQDGIKSTVTKRAENK